MPENPSTPFGQSAADSNAIAPLPPDDSFDAPLVLPPTGGFSPIAMPDYARDPEGRDAALFTSVQVVPQFVLLHSQSPEVKAGGAKAGDFYFRPNLGSAESFRFVVVSFAHDQVWWPEYDGTPRPPLARYPADAVPRHLQHETQWIEQNGKRIKPRATETYVFACVAVSGPAKGTLGLMHCKSTHIKPARPLLSDLTGLARRGGEIGSMVVEVTSVPQSKGSMHWHVPQFKSIGWLPPAALERVKQIKQGVDAVMAAAYTVPVERGVDPDDQ